MPLPARRRTIGVLVALVAAASLIAPAPATASEAVPLTEIGPEISATAPRPGPQGGADTYQWGEVIVAAHQTGRSSGGGAAGIAYAMSGDGGATWSRGTLPGLTTAAGGVHARTADPSVAYDAPHGVWLITSIGLTETGGATGGVTGAAVLTSRSTDGVAWSPPVVTAVGGDLDKSWVVCDNGDGSPYRGQCYAVFDDHAVANAIRVARSVDGGLSWTVAVTRASGLGGQPVVRPNGTVVVPYLSNDGEIRSFRSRDGGASWSESTLVSRVERHTPAGGLRALPLPSAETDAAGTVYVAWHDCRFQHGCAGNDIVLSTSATGERWGDVLRVTGDGGDHVIPGLGVDRASKGERARLAVTYYRYADAACVPATCRLTVGHTSSANGGASWSAPLELHGPMAVGWLPVTGQGRTVGDYISVSVVPGGNAFPVFAVAAPPAEGLPDVRTHTVTGGLPIVPGPAPLASIEAAVAAGEPPPALPLTAR
ncbi:sialidase family protein [Nonomuraea sp. NPDC004580]|uniref:sialidase family protein n=1 Tax=Nonomuraea sp. NPDC004580 TaxID=3154552 RepID=UPI0033AD1A94